MLIKQINNEHREKIEQMEADFSKEIQTLNLNEKELKFSLDEMERENSELKKRLSEEVQLRSKLQDEIYKNIRSHEEEVQLRLQFESKLNGLHSLHRDLQAKYERAIDDIYRLEFNNKVFSEKNEKMETEVITLRSMKIEHESKITY